MSLSQRGRESEELVALSKIWNILRDLWHPSRNPGGYVSLGVAENTLMHDVLSRKIREIESTVTLPHVAFTYGDGTQGSNRLRQAMARFLTRRLRAHREIDAYHVSATNGCSSAIEHITWCLVNPGDGVLLGRPYYATFIADIQFRPGAEVLDVRFGKHIDPMSMEGVKCYEERILDAHKRGQKVKALMLCHPHNPLGRCYRKDVIIALMRLCHQHQIHFISDEIYALSGWENSVDDPRDVDCPELVPFESVASIDPTGIIDPKLVHLLWGVSKDFGANGLRLGAVISQANPELIRSLAPPSLYSSISHLTDHVFVNIFEDEKWTDDYAIENQRRLQESYTVVTSMVRRHGIRYMKGVNAAFFLWIDLGSTYKKNRPQRRFRDDEDITEEITEALLREKVFLASGADFGSEEPGWYRIVFSQPHAMLKEGMRRIVKVVDPNNAIRASL